MADEIINKLGLSVEDALGALQRLDDALQTSGSAFATFGSALDNWNSQADGAVAADEGDGLGRRPDGRCHVQGGRHVAAHRADRRGVHGVLAPARHGGRDPAAQRRLENRGHHGHGHGRQDQGRRHDRRPGDRRRRRQDQQVRRHLGHAFARGDDAAYRPRHEPDSGRPPRGRGAVHRVPAADRRGPDHRPADRRRLCATHQRGRRVRQAVQHPLEGGHRGPVPDPLQPVHVDGAAHRHYDRFDEAGQGRRDGLPRRHPAR